jgi:hypothetical protein
MSLSPIILFIIFLVVAGLVIWKFGHLTAALIAISVPLGIVLYFVVGVSIARIQKLGRFYSVPFGGNRMGGNDVALITSAALWIVLTFLVLRWIKFLVKKREQSSL